MAINRYYNRTAAQPEFYQKPLEYLRVALENKQQRFDKYGALAEALGDTQLDSLQKDRARANAIVRGYNERITGITDEFGGDYSRMGKSLLGLAREIKSDFSPGGEAHAIELNKRLFDAWEGRQQKLLGKKDGIRAEQLNAARAYLLENYGGVGQLDANTGTYNVIQTEEINPYIDLNELVDTYGSAVVANKISSGAWTRTADGKLWVKNKVGVEEVTPERVRAAIESGVLSNQQYMDYAQQMARFGNPIDPVSIELAVQRGVMSYAREDREFDQSIMFDPYSLEKYKKGLEEDVPLYQRFSPVRKTEGAKELSAWDFPNISGKAYERSGSNYSSLSGVNPPQHLQGMGIDAKTIQEYVSNPGIQQKYGPLLNESYEYVRQHVPGYDKMSEKEKFNVTKRYYDAANSAMTSTRDLNIVMNAKTIEKLNKQNIESGAFERLSYTWIDGDGNTHSGLSYEEAQSLGKWPEKGDKDFRTTASMNEIFQPASGLPAGYVVDVPYAKRDGYLIMHEANAELHEMSMPFQELLRPGRDPSYNESSPVVMPGTSDDILWSSQGRSVWNPKATSPEDAYSRELDFFVHLPIRDNSGRIVDYEKRPATMQVPNPQTGEVQTFKMDLEAFQSLWNGAAGIKSFTHKSENTINY